MTEHRLKLPTNETTLIDGRKVHHARCVCGHDSTGPDFAAAIAEHNAHIRDHR